MKALLDNFKRYLYPPIYNHNLFFASPGFKSSNVLLGVPVVRSRSVKFSKSKKIRQLPCIYPCIDYMDCLFPYYLYLFRDN